MITCGKFDKTISLSPTLVRSKNISLKKKTTRTSLTNSHNIAVSESNILYCNRYYSYEEFQSIIVKDKIKKITVLTNLEFRYIADHPALSKIKTIIIENDYQIFPDIKYSKNLKYTLAKLDKCTKKLNQLGVTNVKLNQFISNKHWNSVVSKIKNKSPLDGLFFFSSKEAFQEVFKLKEERENRVIIALDYNSMYVDGMRGEFCDPRELQYRNFNKKCLKEFNKDLSPGIYSVKLIGAKNSFLLDHHYFIYKNLGKGYPFKLELGGSIEAILHHNEISYLSCFFDSTEIIEGVFSEKTISHPLINKAERQYKERLHHRKRKDSIKENLSKISLQFMHSSTFHKSKIKNKLTSYQDGISYLNKIFGGNVKVENKFDFFSLCINSKFLLNEGDEPDWAIADITTGKNIYSLSSTVLANARLKMLKTLESFLLFNSLEVCYINTDSIHISIDKNYLEDFFMEFSEVISDRLGDLKIEAIASRGYWFDVGRYWLFKNNDVILFKNIQFNQKWSNSKFTSKRIYFRNIKGKYFSLLRRYAIRIENSFSYRQSIKYNSSKNWVYKRFSYDQIENIRAANITVSRTILNTKKIKTELFNSIKDGKAFRDTR